MNWWLMAVAVVLGLVLTSAFMATAASKFTSTGDEEQARRRTPPPA